MDLSLLGRAVARHPVVATAGFMVALTLALLAFVRVDLLGTPVFRYRSGETWSSQVRLQIQEPGFPEGSIVDPGRQNVLATLAPLYAQLANSNSVRRIMRASGPVAGTAIVSAIIDSNNRASLPIIEITSLTRKKDQAGLRALRQAQAFIAYMAEQQRSSEIRPARRISLKVIKGPTGAEVAVPRKKTIPVVVFLSMLVMVGALLLSVENMAMKRARRSQRPSVEEAARKDGERAEPQQPPEHVTSSPRTTRHPSTKAASTQAGRKSEAPVEKRSPEAGKWALRQGQSAD